MALPNILSQRTVDVAYKEEEEEEILTQHLFLKKGNEIDKNTTEADIFRN